MNTIATIFCAIALFTISAELKDIRTILSESRDTLNCIQTPADPACIVTIPTP